jgi:hypothetical protein
MQVPMVDNLRMFQPLMPVGMRVRFARRIVGLVLVLVLVLVMRVVRMFVLMCHWFVNMPAFMSFLNV